MREQSAAEQDGAHGVAHPTEHHREAHEARKHVFFAKRTHRFWKGFLMQLSSSERLMAETDERNRWVRFGKRTHRSGINRGCSPKTSPDLTGRRHLSLVKR